MKTTEFIGGSSCCKPEASIAASEVAARPGIDLHDSATGGLDALGVVGGLLIASMTENVIPGLARGWYARAKSSCRLPGS